jgi:putative peptide zinc metalloprotease protein
MVVAAVGLGLYKGAQALWALLPRTPQQDAAQLHATQKHAAQTHSAQKHAPLLSEHWYRVSHLTPKRAPQVQMDGVAYRGGSGVVLTLEAGFAAGTDTGAAAKNGPDASSAQRLRLNARAYAFYGRCDGNRTVQQLWQALLAQDPEAAPSQDELIALVLQLYRGGWLLLDGHAVTDSDTNGNQHAVNFGALMPASGQEAHQSRMAPGAPGAPGTKAPNHLLSWRVPLGNPDAWLSRWVPAMSKRLTPMWLRALMMLWLAVVAAGAASAAVQWPVLRSFIASWLHSPHVVVLTWVLFVAMKALHEGAHAVVLKHLGGRVPQWGVTFMVFTPTPYVDASAADSLASPRQRFAVSAAGAMLELALAAAAMLLASVLQDGLLRDACWVVCVVGAVSGLLVNANPLLRFDGYYALTDALELPNLAQRSQQHWRSLLLRALGLPTEARRAATPYEHAAWWAYAPAALACRVVLSLAIVAWLGNLSFVLGAGVALLLLFSLLGLPALRGVRLLWGAQAAPATRQRARQRAAMVVGLLLAVLFVVPVPHATVARGVVWLPDDAVVRAPSAAFMQQVLVQDGQRVAAGELLFVLHDPGHAAEQARLESQALQLDIAQQGAQALEPAKAQRLGSERAAVQSALQQLAERQAQRELRAAVGGQVQLRHERLVPLSSTSLSPHAVPAPSALDWTDRFVPQGTVLATVVPQPGPPVSVSAQPPMTVRLVLDEGQAARWRASPAQEGSGSGSVSVWLNASASAPADAVPATVVRDLTAVLNELPSPALADRFGGDIVTLPTDIRGTTTARGVVWLDVQVTPTAAATLARSPIAGTRVWVRLAHGHQALGLTALRGLQEAVLLHFNPRR